MPKKTAIRHPPSVPRLSRATAALVGGYAFAHAGAGLLTVVLPMSRVNRVVSAGLLSFVARGGDRRLRHAQLLAQLVAAGGRCWLLLIGGGVMRALWLYRYATAACVHETVPAKRAPEPAPMKNTFRQSIAWLHT